MATIYIYDSNQWGIMGLVYDKTFQVSSVSDMVEKVLGATKDEKYKSEIFLPSMVPKITKASVRESILIRQATAVYSWMRTGICWAMPAFRF